MTGLTFAGAYRFKCHSVLLLTLEVWVFIIVHSNLPTDDYDELPPFKEEQLYASNYNGPEGMWCTGINAAGFDLGAFGGRNSKYYRPPEFSAIEYFYNRGANCFRLPITWERLQMELGDEHLSLVYGYERTIDFITRNLSSYAIIDPHNNDVGLQFNYGSYDDARHRDATKEDFLRLWRALASRFKNNSKVIFELYNEPKYGRENGKNKFFDYENDDHSGELIQAWFVWLQEAINEIRALGAENMILVPGLKHTNCRDWDGAGYWGESLDGYTRSGNTRLAALTDPQMKLIYDVHQYFDSTWVKSFTGDQYGCAAHDATLSGELGADEGCLVNMVAWAKKYNKKVMVTEIASMPDPYLESYNYSECASRMQRFLREMNESGVFLGFQIWQFGCPTCKGDLHAERPLNLDWYGLGKWIPSPPEDVPRYDSAQLNKANYAGPEGMWCTGVNAVGFNLDEIRGRYGIVGRSDLVQYGVRTGYEWNVPDETAINYFHDRGANCFRLPITWERLQADLNDRELDLVLGYERIVDYITATLGDYVIIDPHSMYGLKFHAGFDEDALSTKNDHIPYMVPRVVDVTRAEFVRLWHAIAQKWKNNPKVLFGLYDDPKNGYEDHTGDYFKAGQETSQMVETWWQWAQSAIDEIRAVGANNTVLVPGLKRSSCRDWDGADQWGQSLDNISGNARLAALTDPAKNLVYDVKQFFDSTVSGSFTGDQYGCDGHEKTVGGGLGADEGCLTNMVSWAKTYNKKMMMTGFASFADPEDDSTWRICKSKMHDFLQRMNKSGVFLGYQVWQFGCPHCKGDLYAMDPSNLDWYGFDLYGTSRSSTSTTSTSTTLLSSTPTASTTLELLAITNRALGRAGIVVAAVPALCQAVHSLL